MPAPTIYYIRHGETSWNAEGRLQGVQDVPLNDLGRQQAAGAGNILADLFARDRDARIPIVLFLRLTPFFRTVGVAAFADGEDGVFLAQFHLLK